jgi:hypothetical protein
MFFKDAIFWHHPLVSSESLFQSPAADIAPGRKIFVAMQGMSWQSVNEHVVRSGSGGSERTSPEPLTSAICNVVDCAELTSRSRSAV